MSLLKRLLMSDKEKEQQGITDRYNQTVINIQADTLKQQLISPLSNILQSVDEQQVICLFKTINSLLQLNIDSGDHIVYINDHQLQLIFKNKQLVSITLI